MNLTHRLTALWGWALVTAHLVDYWSLFPPTYETKCYLSLLVGTFCLTCWWILHGDLKRCLNYFFGESDAR